MKKLFFIFIILFISNFSKGQQVQFSKIYFNSGYYKVIDFMELKDSGFFILGQFGSNSNNAYFPFALRLNQYGDTIYKNTIGNYATYPGEGKLYNDSTLIVTPSSWNGVSGINTLLMNINTLDTFSHRTYGIPGTGYSSKIIKTSNSAYLMYNQLGQSY